MKNTLVIINPKQREKHVKKLIKYLAQEGFNDYVICINKKELKTEVKKFCNSKYKYLLIWGGDGTVHRVVNILTKEKILNKKINSKAIGFFKGGSGNGIQESYEVAGSLKKQILNYKKSIQKKYIIATDLIKIKSKDFIKYTQLIGLGLDADIVKERRDNRYIFGRYKGQVKKGFLNYFFSAIKVFLNKKSFQKNFSLTFYNGRYFFFGTRVNSILPFKKLKRSISAPIVEIGTRPYYGSMFKICPFVICNDGYMDVYLFCFKHKATFLFNLIDLYLGRQHHINKRFERKNKGIIEHYKVKKMKIKIFSSMNLHIDGELFECKTDKDNSYSLMLEIMPLELNLIALPGFYQKFHPFE